MLNIFYTPKFIRSYKILDVRLKEEIKEKIGEFRNTKNHTKLKVHKLKGIENTYSFSVNFKVRIIFEYQKNKKSTNFLEIGYHDDLYR